MAKTSPSRPYDKAVNDASWGLVHHWERLDAGDSGKKEYKFALFKAELAAKESRQPFFKVWGDVKRKASELCEED